MKEAVYAALWMSERASGYETQMRMFSFKRLKCSKEQMSVH